MTQGVEIDPCDARRARHAPGLLRAFNDAGVLAAADVHVAVRLASLVGGAEEEVALAVALAVRAPRLGHVYVDLATIRETATVDRDDPVDVTALPWPDDAGWRARVEASPLVAVGEEGAGADGPSGAAREAGAGAARPTAPRDGGEASRPGDDAAAAGRGEADPRPLRLVGTALYLDRYWREERAVARDLLALAGAAPGGVREEVLADGITRLFGAQRDGRQALAAAAAVLSRFAVVAGGPGTGKTTTVAQIVALLAEQAAAAGAPPPLVALAAPTGKAAARLQEAVREAADVLAVAPAQRDVLRALSASTLHRLLGWRPDSHSRFRHHRGNRLPHDVVIVDETSMVSLSLMGRLVEAVRPDARLILVGDPGQLTSIEAGAVLGDVVGPAADGPRIGDAAATRLARAVGTGVAATSAAPPVVQEQPAPQAALTLFDALPAPSDAASSPPAGAPAPAFGDTPMPAPSGAASSPPAATSAPAFGDAIVVLDRVHRFGAGIAALAEGIRRGHADDVLATLAAAPEGVTWLDVDAAADPDALTAVRARAVAAGQAVIAAAMAGEARAALDALGAFRLLCAHRRGPGGVAAWTTRVEGWLAETVGGLGVGTPWYVGRPLLVTENDYGLRLHNGDAGVVIRTPEGDATAAFDRGGQVGTVRPGRLGPLDTAYALTIHKSQGSQFETAAVLLPEPGSRILSRELLYTAVTRASRDVIVVGTAETVRSAVERPAARASGLRARLWGD